MQETLTVTITVNGVERVFKGDYDTLHNNEWEVIVRDLLDLHNN